MILKLLTRNNFRYRKWKEDKEDVQIFVCFVYMFWVKEKLNKTTKNVSMNAN